MKSQEKKLITKEHIVLNANAYKIKIITHSLYFSTSAIKLMIRQLYKIILGQDYYRNATNQASFKCFATCTTCHL